MAVDTYSNLKAEIAEHLDRDDLAPKIDTFIDLAEARHRRKVRMREMITRAALTLDAKYEDLSTGFLEGISLRILTTPITHLRYISPDEMASRARDSTGRPKYYTIGAQFEFDVAPDASYSAEVLYYQAVTALSSSNETNAILTYAPDLYLYGALMASAPYLMNDERLALWSDLYKSAEMEVNEMSKKMGVVGPLISRVYGV